MQSKAENKCGWLPQCFSVGLTSLAAVNIDRLSKDDAALVGRSLTFVLGSAHVADAVGVSDARAHTQGGFPQKRAPCAAAVIDQLSGRLMEFRSGMSCNHSAMLSLTRRRHRVT